MRARTSATSSGWLIYGDASASFRRWLRCLRAAKVEAFSSAAASVEVFGVMLARFSSPTRWRA